MSHGSSIDRIVAELRRLAASARAGEALPSSRDLIARYRVGPVTVSRAIARLAAEGVVVSEPGRGTFVAARRDTRRSSDFGWQTVALQDRFAGGEELTRLLAPSDPGTLLLASGYLDAALQPTRALSDALSRAARRPGSWDRAPLAGIPELRTAFATSVGVEPADVLVVPGGQAGLSAALRGLVPAGGVVAVESPTYVGVLCLARAAGLRAVPVPCDDEGIRPDLLAETLALTGARVVHCQPTYTNPTGAVMSARRRSEVLEVARAAGAFVLEDDCVRLLSLTATPPPPLVRDDADGHVVYLASLTKAAAPSLRVGALVARGPALARLRGLRMIDDLFVPIPMQEAAVGLLAAPAWQRHLTTLRRELLSRRDALVAGLAEYAPAATITRVPGGGFHLWIRLPDGTDDVELARRCELRGLMVSAGTAYYAGEPPAPHIRMTYCAEPEARLDEAARVFGGVLSELAGPGG
jgi:DNA-binding transcriptional MocR family regulator